MFASNQQIKITGEYHDIPLVLGFALKLSGYDKNLTRSEIERGCKLVYQITKSGKYCIGWGFKDVPWGWQEYPFDFDIDIVSKIIEQHLKKHTPINDDDYEITSGDGSTGRGFLMKCPWMKNEWENEEDIQNNFYCIVYFEPFYNYYAK